MDPNFGAGNFMLIVIPVMVVVCFIVVFGVVIYAIIRGIDEWSKNNNSPVLTVKAKIVAKRISINGHAHFTSDNFHMRNSPSTTYYTAFEVENGDRMEFRISSSEYGILAKGDNGNLTFQGTRYKKFERDTAK